MECPYCKNVFNTKYSLKNHIKTARYCIKQRGKDSDKEEFVCCKCPKTFTSKRWLLAHQEKCGESVVSLKETNRLLDDKIKNLEKSVVKNRLDYEERLKNQENKYEQKILKLQDKLENIAIRAVERPTSTTNNMKTNINNFIQNMEPMTSENLLEHTGNLTLEHVQKGASGYAEYALEYPFKDRVACVDYSRRKIKFKDNDGHLVTDPEMVKLAPMFFDSIKDKSSQLVYSQNDPNMDSVMFEQVAKLFNTNADVKNGSSGIKSDFYHDFIKHVCSGSLID
jgi:hypothetical protein